MSSSSLLVLQAQTYYFTFLIPLILFIIFLCKRLYNKNLQYHLPPSPPKLPIIGHLHQLGQLPHRTLRTLSNKYGKLMLLYLGNRPTLVVSSAAAAEEIMKTHDITFANRPKLRFNNKIFYDGNDVAFQSYGKKWRHMKSLCVLQLLSNNKIQSFRSVREEEVGIMVDKIKSKSIINGQVINLSEMLMTLSFDLVCRVALGRKYDTSVLDGDSGNFHELCKEFMEVLGAVSVGDYVPFLGWIDGLTGLERRVDIVRKRLDDFMEQVVQDHHNNRANLGLVVDDDQQQNVKDFVDVMLDAQNDNPEAVSRDDIKAVILDMFAGGTETSSTVMEWAMTELIRHPNVMKKVKSEIRDIIKTKTRVTEDDLENMEYLKAVIKETLRLHPPGPLLLFRESTKNVKIYNYDIAAKTQVIINAWAIQRDPEFWQNPDEFHPERFLDNNNTSFVDFKGQHFQFIPFGAGRRGCPGVSYAFLVTRLVLATLIYEFNWTLPQGREGSTLDVTERAGISIRPHNPLNVIASSSVPCA